MICVAEADRLIRAQLPPATTETVPLADCAGRVLAETIRADRDQPPFDRVAMDGIGLAWADLAAEKTTFRLTGVQPAGRPALAWGGPGTALEVTTGAILPIGCDTIIPYEDLDISAGVAQLQVRGRLDPAQNIHFRGSDYRQGEILLEAGCLIQSVHLHTLATVGQSQVTVLRRARVAVAGTGDELVPVFNQPLDYQIRRSNAAAILAEAGAWGLKIDTDVHLPDDEQRLTEGLRALLSSHQVIVLSGGVSMGNFDLVPRTLINLGCREIFHKVSQKPGKPLWFGVGLAGQLVFGLPGNPVSSLFSFRRYVLPLLLEWEGRSTGDAVAEVAGLKAGRPGATHFVPVARTGSDLRVLPVEGSGNFYQLAGSAGFIQIDEDFVPDAGRPVPFFPWGRSGGRV